MHPRRRTRIDCVCAAFTTHTPKHMQYIKTCSAHCRLSIHWQAHIENECVCVENRQSMKIKKKSLAARTMREARIYNVRDIHAHRSHNSLQQQFFFYQLDSKSCSARLHLVCLQKIKVFFFSHSFIHFFCSSKRQRTLFGEWFFLFAHARIR